MNTCRAFCKVIFVEITPASAMDAPLRREVSAAARAPPHRLPQAQALRHGGRDERHAAGPAVPRADLGGAERLLRRDVQDLPRVRQIRLGSLSCSFLVWRTGIGELGEN